MKVEVGNVWSQMVSGTQAELEWLDEYTSCDFRVWSASPNWSPDQRYHLFDRTTRRFPSGFIKLLGPAARRSGIQLDVVDTRVKPCLPDLDHSLAPWLRDYQWDACWNFIAKGGRGLIQIPTGGGKTECFIGLTRVLPCEWLFVVHRADLVGQAAKRFKLRTGEDAGMWDGRWKKGTSNVTVATFQGLAYAIRKKNPDVFHFLDSMGALCVDETHAQSAEQFYGVTLRLGNAYYRLGLSGTPLDRGEKDNMRTIGAIGPVIYDVKTDLLVSLGLLSPSKIRMVMCKHPTTSHDQVGEISDWHAVYRDLVVRSPERNVLLADMAEQAMKPCLMFVEEMDHGFRLQKLMEDRGLKVDFASGKDWLKMRQDRIAKLVDGEIDVLLCTVIFQEGIDIPELRSVVVAAAKSSAVAALQRIGRGMRVSAGKTEFEVWDVLDRGQTWLMNHANARVEAYESRGHVVEKYPTMAKLLGKTAQIA